MATQLERDCLLLKENFSRDNRFHYRKMIASGNYGSAHHVQYNDESKPNLTEFLVKKSFNNEDAEAALRLEKGYLASLRGAKHLVQMLDIENNPLSAPGTGEWIILEWIPNGTLAHFMANAHDLGVEYLPNRLLWRFLFCLVRACIGMAWPTNRTDNLLVDETPIPGVPPSTLEHNDLHRGNILLGDFLAEPEHGISPILKVIDFGLAGQWAWAEGAAHGPPGNIWDIGAIMVSLITLNPYLKVDRPGEREPVEVSYMGMNFQSQAHAILPTGTQGGPNPWLEDDLTLVVARCLATDPAQRPNLFTLHAWLTIATSWDQNRYGVETEKDEIIKKLCQEIILDPPPPADGSAPVIVLS